MRRIVDCQTAKEEALIRESQNYKGSCPRVGSIIVINETIVDARHSNKKEMRQCVKIDSYTAHLVLCTPFFHDGRLAPITAYRILDFATGILDFEEVSAPICGATWEDLDLNKIRACVAEI